VSSAGPDRGTKCPRGPRPHWEVVEAAFGELDAPSTLLGVTVLGYADQLVEIEAVAAVSG
jgi:hypothetical protein